MKSYWTIRSRIMQCQQIFAERHTKPIQTHFYKIDQKEHRCVKCGRKWTILDTTRHNVSLLTISGDVTLTRHLDRNVIKHAQKRRNWSKLIMQARIWPEFIISRD